MPRNWDNGNDDEGKNRSGGRRWDTGQGVATPTRAPDGQRVQNKSGGQQIDELIQKIEPLIEQVNNLYQMFISGIERLPPNEKRKQLEALLHQLQNIPKPNQTYHFRVSTLNAHLSTLRDRWDRLIRDLESGKIRRPTGSKRP